MKLSWKANTWQELIEKRTDNTYKVKQDTRLNDQMLSYIRSNTFDVFSDYEKTFLAHFRKMHKEVRIR